MIKDKQNKDKPLNLVSNRKVPPRCSEIKKNGEKCKGIAMKQTGKCSIHSGIMPYQSAKIQLDRSPADVRKYLAKLVFDTRKGKVSPNTSNAIANLMDKILKCHDKLELEAKMDQILAEVGKSHTLYAGPDSECIDIPLTPNVALDDGKECPRCKARIGEKMDICPTCGLYA